MKALFISYNQSYGEEIAALLESHGQRGFTRWVDIQGRGSKDGIPHFGNHAWPEMNVAILAMVDDDVVGVLLDELKAKDLKTPALGIRAFVWNIENAY